MTRLRTIVALVTLVAACSPDDDPPPKERAAPARHDAAPAVEVADHEAAHDLDPVHDDAPPRPLFPGESTDYQPTGRYRQPTAPSRTLEITLRSTPAGAMAAVDGKIVGPTPTFWRGKMTGKAREFTFVLPDYAMARYRFVPTTDGVVHATLEPLMDDEADAGARP